MFKGRKTRVGIDILVSFPSAQAARVVIETFPNQYYSGRRSPVLLGKQKLQRRHTAQKLLIASHPLFTEDEFLHGVG